MEIDKLLFPSEDRIFGFVKGAGRSIRVVPK